MLSNKDKSDSVVFENYDDQDYGYARVMRRCLDRQFGGQPLHYYLGSCPACYTICLITNPGRIKTW
jgi:hypothetical protein